VLHSAGTVPEGYQMVDTLSRIFTETLGPWAKNAFLVGAFFVLYSTLFTAAASWARVWADAFGQIGWMRFESPQEQRKSIGILSWILPAAWCILFLFFQSPVKMVILGGIATSVLLLLVVYVSLVFRYRRLPASLKPSPVYDLFFWISVLSILFVSAYGVIRIV
jgi:vacuolar-type H+-ATPase subunit I/STV1